MSSKGGYYEMLRRLSLESAASSGSERPVAGETGRPRCGSYLEDGSDQRPQCSPCKAASGETTEASSPVMDRMLMKNALVWIDLGVTGLDLEKDTILEIAIIITDGDLRQELLGPELAIHHSDAVLGDMNDWSRDQHGRSGLTARCRASTISLQAAEEASAAFVARHCDSTTAHHLAGSSVHVDLTFLRRHMPALAALLPYRVVDVSTVMELCRRWYPSVYSKAPRKRGQHTALADIQDSIRALTWLRSRIFKPPQSLSGAPARGGAHVVPGA